MFAASTASICSTDGSDGSARRASRSGWSRMITPIERRIFSSLLAPKPETRRSRPARTAASRSAIEATPSSRLSCSARLGPMPGTVAICCTPGGILARSSSTAAMVPLRRNSMILPAIDEPTPGTLVSAASGTAPRSAG
jgi:hypothetical protein